MSVFTAGYMIEEVIYYLEKKGYHTLHTELAPYLMYQLDPNIELARWEVHPLYAIANNILSRGLPTRSSIYISQQILSAIFDEYFQQEDSENISFSIPFHHMDDILASISSSDITHLLTEPLFEEKKLLAQLLITPLAIAKIQKIFLHLLAAQPVEAEARIWRLLVIERDVPCAYLAIKDLQTLLKHIFQLAGMHQHLPEIQLSVLPSKSFYDTPLSQQIPQELRFDPQATSAVFDAVIDIANISEPYFPVPRVLKDIPYYKIRYHNNYQTPVNRGILFTHPITYPSLGKPNSNLHFVYKSLPQKEALSYLYQNLFRKVSVPKGTPEILDKMLRGKDYLIGYPDSSERLQAFFLGGLLQPSVSPVVYSDDTEITLHAHQLKRHAINTYTPLKYGDTPITLQEKINTLLDCQSQFVFVALKLMHEPDFQQALKRLYEACLPFNYILLESVQSISEWSPFFDVSYASIASQLRSIFGEDTYLSLGALAPILTYDVATDVQYQLGLSEDDYIQLPSSVYSIKSLRFTVIPVPFRDNHSLLQDREKEIVMVKYPILKRLLKNIPFEQVVSDSPDADSTPLAHDSSYQFGGILYDQQYALKSQKRLEALRNYLQSEAYLDISLLAPHTDRSQSPDTLTEFLSQSSNLLITHYQNSATLTAPHHKFSVHYHQPLSPEHFYHETRFTPTQNESYTAYVLFHPSDIRSAQQYVTAHFKYVEPKQDHLDQPSESKLITELLTRVSYTDNFLLYYLEKKLTTYIGERVSVKIAQKHSNIYELTIESHVAYQAFSGQPKVYGNIRLPELSTSFQLTQFVSQTEAASILQYTIELIQNFCPSQDYLSLIEHYEGIGLLDMIQHDTLSEKQLSIGFYNGYLNRLTDLLKTEGNSGIDFPFIEEIAAMSPTATAFIQNMERAYPRRVSHEIKRLQSELNGNQNTVEQNKQLKRLIGGSQKFLLSSEANATIQHIYPHIRLKKDTLKVLYHLKILGVIQDYTLDNQHGVVNVSVLPYDPERYIDNLRSFMMRYIGVAASERWLQGLDLTNTAKEVVVHISKVLSGFVATVIAPKRLNTTNYMQLICDQGLKNGNVSVHDYLAHYFNSLFASKAFLPLEIKNGRDTIEIVDKYLQFITSPPEKLDVGSEIAILKHIICSCEIVLEQLPKENHSICVLHAYAEILLLTHLKYISEDENLYWDRLQSAKDRFATHLMSLRDTNTDEEIWFATLRKFVSHSANFHPELGSVFTELTDALMISYYGQWLASFNNKFIDSIQ